MKCGAGGAFTGEGGNCHLQLKYPVLNLTHSSNKNYLKLKQLYLWTLRAPLQTSRHRFVVTQLYILDRPTETPGPLPTLKQWTQGDTALLTPCRLPELTQKVFRSG